MWLKEYLNLGPDRALWGYIGDTIYTVKVPNSEKNVDPRVRINPLTVMENCLREENKNKTRTESLAGHHDNLPSTPGRPSLLKGNTETNANLVSPGGEREAVAAE
jgi:hypothetical protein